MTLQGGFAPAKIALIIADFDEKPTWKDAEVLDGLDLGHLDCWGEVGRRKRGGEETGGRRREKRKRQSRKKRKKESRYPCNRMRDDREL